MAGSVSTNNVWPNYHQNNVQKAADKSSSNTLGKDQFLSILVTQLRNQDPMQPMQDREFIAQMAQFTSVEQLMNMATEIGKLRQSIGSASSMIGKWVEWQEYSEDGQIVSLNGKVDSILSKDGVLYAKIGDSQVALDYLISISEDQPGQGSGSESAEEDGEVETA
ncbi:flagellar hook capping FlgD N-terminal domain-containing protein [Paenibacillus sp. CAU 1782]